MHAQQAPIQQQSRKPNPAALPCFESSFAEYTSRAAAVAFRNRCGVLELTATKLRARTRPNPAPLAGLRSALHRCTSSK